MPIKSILCAYSGDAARGSGLNHAIRLAQHHKAHLTGVLRHGISRMAERYYARLPSRLKDEIKAADAALIADVAGRFNAAAEAAGLADKAAFVEVDPATDGPLSAFAYAYDLVVTGLPSTDEREAHLAANPDALALKSGRPVLVVPDGYDASGLADRAIVAWDGKRSAARALSDAMEILAEKSNVTLLSVGREPQGTARMVDNMRLHGIKVSARTVAQKGSIAKAILEEAEADDVKLIVMGAFEHSKFAHDLFGGVTTDVMARSKVPVYLAH